MASRRKRKKRVLPVQDGITHTQGKDEMMALIEAALNDADIGSVWVSHLLHAELLADSVDPMDGDEFEVLPASVPGRVMVVLYDRRQSNVRIFPLDAEGGAYAEAFVRDPKWDELLPRVVGSGSPEPKPHQA
jgi:hypothetical protein